MKDDETRVTDLLLITDNPRSIKVRKGAIECFLLKSCITISKDPIVDGEHYRTISVTMPDWLAIEKNLE